MTTNMINLSNKGFEFQKGARVWEVTSDGIARVERKIDSAVSRQQTAKICQKEETSANADHPLSFETNAETFDDIVEVLGEDEVEAPQSGPLPLSLAEPQSPQTPIAIVQFSGLLRKIEAQPALSPNGNLRPHHQEQLLPSRAETPIVDMPKSATIDMPTVAPQAATVDVSHAVTTGIMLQKLPPKQDGVDGSPQISIERLKKETGFESPIVVLSNDQRRYQPAQAAASRLAKIFLQSNETSGALSGARQVSTAETVVKPSSRDIDIADEPVDDAVQMRVTELAPKPARAQTMQNDQERTRQAVNGPAAAKPAASKTEGVLVPAETVQNMSAPSQQVRVAIADAISNSTAAPQTDYVSLFDDRQVTPGPTVRTLELALSPQGLGHVQIKMNLAGGDLQLNVEANRADTARLIASDRDELQRELRGDGVELTSLSVTVRDQMIRSDDVRNGSGGLNSETPSKKSDASMGDMNSQRDANGSPRDSEPAIRAPLKSSVDAVVEAKPPIDRKALYI